jgi:hypothetical protein
LKKWLTLRQLRLKRLQLKKWLTLKIILLGNA